MSFLLGVILFFTALILAVTFWPVTLTIIWGAICYGIFAVVSSLLVSAVGVSAALTLGAISAGLLFIWPIRKFFDL